MNPTCFVCGQMATRVCHHPDCKEPPFFCDGPCVKGTAERIHTHQGVINYKTYDQLVSIVQREFSDPYRQYILKMSKKVLIIQESLDKALLQHQQSLKKDIGFELQDRAKELVDSLNNRQFDRITGKHVDQFVNRKDIYNNQIQTMSSIQYFKRNFEQMLDNFQSTLSGILPIKVRRQKTIQLSMEGKKLKEINNYQCALWKFNEAIFYCPYLYSIYEHAGYCCYALQKFQQAEMNYSKVLQLNPKSEIGFNNMGILQSRLKHHEVAIGNFSKAIEINGSYSIAYNNRGKEYLKVEKYNEGLADFLKALEIDPQNQKYLLNKTKAMRLLTQFQDKRPRRQSAIIKTK